MKWQPSHTFKAWQVVFITIFWVLINILMELHNAVNYDPATRGHFLYFMFGRNAAEHFLITSVGPLIGGLFAGTFIVFYQREKLKGKTYRQKLLIHSALYVLFVSFCILLAGAVGAMNNHTGSSFWNNLYTDVISLRVLRLVLAWYVVVIATIFLLDITEKFGAATLKRMLLGKYHTPGKEQRIFMFLDLKSSTTIAESIGDERYFKMLHFFYQVANEAILQCNGEIYQYVGDEIVISWRQEQGLKNANCLQCFTAVEKAVEENAERFKNGFGVVPRFKAGVHTGTVVTGEIGTIKKDIVYSGDVLNTTARIVALCNAYEQKLMISSTLYNLLTDKSGYQFTLLGSPELRGKKIALDLYGVSGK